MPLLEREAALGLLTDTLAAVGASGGGGRIVLLSGEAGIGKSALLNAFMATLPAGVRALRGDCEALFTPRALGPLLDMAPSMGLRLHQLLATQAPTAGLFPAVMADLRDSGRTTVLALEDVHWADHATLDLVKHVGRRIASVPLLLLLSFRDDELDADHPLRDVVGDLPSGAVRRITLAPLSPQAVAQLARHSGRRPEGLHRATGGNPFFLTEILAVQPDGDAWLPAAGGDDLAVPASVRDAVWARLRRLDAAERRLLEVACVVPGRVDDPLLQHLCRADGLDAADAAVARAACLQRGLLLATPGGVMFRHELARLATEESLPAGRRLQMHQRALEGLRLNTDGAIARALHHAAQAADSAQVLALAPAAAATAARLGAHREAAAHFATGLRHADAAPAALRAELHEGWAYEAALALGITDAVVASRHEAIRLWRQCGRTDRVGANLMALSRLHRYLGQQPLADRFADEAVTVLESLPPGHELAMAYSVRSQQYMLEDRTDDAARWGRRALALAATLGDTEVQVHALNNVGTALAFAQRPGGVAQLEQSLALALAHGFHEHAARAYTNLAQYLVHARRFAEADRVLADGIAFDTQNDLHAKTSYLVGWLAQLRLDQGRWADAERIAAEVLATDRLTPVMRLPALVVTMRLAVRRGEPDAALIDEVAALAHGTGESEGEMAAAAARAEDAWLRGQLADGLTALGWPLPSRGGPFERGELWVWHRRCGGAAAAAPADLAEPCRLELAGQPQAAADAWAAIGAPYEEALALLQVEGEGAGAALVRAASLLDALGARPAARRVREKAQTLGVSEHLPRARRGPYTGARDHPFGLTRREAEILAALADGLSNAGIAQRLSRSPRTVAHHVSALLAKLGVTSRAEAVALARRHGVL